MGKSVASRYGVTLLNISLPLSTLPFLSQSSTSQASVDPRSVQDIWSALPCPKKSNITPFAASVSWKPSPPTSTTIGSSSASKQYPQPNPSSKQNPLSHSQPVPYGLHEQSL